VIRRYAKRTDATQKAIVEALRKVGVKVWIISEPCDLLTLYRGVWRPIECKPVKRKRNDQEKQTEFLKDTATQVCRTPEAAIAAVTGATYGH
jgi:hypothetical protein